MVEEEARIVHVHGSGSCLCIPIKPGGLYSYTYNYIAGGCAFVREEHGLAWCGVVWCGVAWCGVVWRGVAWCGVCTYRPAPGLRRPHRRASALHTR